jgi:hypothetical protein
VKLSVQLFPEVIDGSTLGQRVTNPVYLPIGIEGQADSDGDAVVNTVYSISSASEAVAHFGAASSLTALCKYLIDRGATRVTAVASAKNAAPTLVQRQAAWQTLEARREVRIRLTDDIAQATHVALATSCDNANMLNNKQFAIVGMAAATTKAALITAATAIASKRVCLVGPAVYDENGVVKSGAYLAASIAALVAQNNDPADDLDTLTIPKLTGMEKDALGNNLFRSLVVAGVVVNDFEDLLQGGVSPVMPPIDGTGGVAISHLRMTYKADTSFDALMTRIIMDQLFVGIRDQATSFLSLRKGNTDTTRGQLQSRIDAFLKSNNDIVMEQVLGDGSTGYGVNVQADTSGRQQIISYGGQVVRGTQTILVNGNLVIAA